MPSSLIPPCNWLCRSGDTYLAPSHYAELKGHSPRVHVPQGLVAYRSGPTRDTCSHLSVRDDLSHWAEAGPESHEIKAISLGDTAGLNPVSSSLSYQLLRRVQSTHWKNQSLTKAQHSSQRGEHKTPTIRAVQPWPMGSRSDESRITTAAKRSCRTPILSFCLTLESDPQGERPGARFGRAVSTRSRDLARALSRRQKSSSQQTARCASSRLTAPSLWSANSHRKPLTSWSDALRCVGQSPAR